MKLTSTRSGFSLVELLTVIAIIAILAAIIFPVMATVKERANQNQCMTNLHQVQLGLQMFKQDNRKYPEVLSTEVEFNGGDPLAFENCTRGEALFREYVKNYQLFHCPSSKVTNSRDYAEYNPGITSMPKKVYAYDSYSYGLRNYDTSSGEGAAYKVYTQPDPHYVREWAPDVNSVQVLKAYPPNEVAANDPVGMQRDYERQLKFKNPPGDTLITWCAYHADKGKALVIFLDGHADTFPIAEMEECRWRLRQKKS